MIRPAGGRIQIVMLAANPGTTSQLTLDREARAISEKLRLADDRSIDFTTCWAVRPDDLLQYLNQYRPQIVHFSGPGAATGEIVLSNETGGEHRVDTAALARLFQVMKDDIRVVVLNAGYSAVQARAISAHIDYVVGMRAPIDARAATVFAAAFYSALGFRRTVAEAFDQATTAVMLHGLPDHAIPELIIRAGIGTPDPAPTERVIAPLPEPVDDIVPASDDRMAGVRMAGEIALAANAVPIATAAIAMYGRNVLAKAHDEVTDATIKAGLRILQRIFGRKKTDEALPAVIEDVAANPGDDDVVAQFRLAVRRALESDSAIAKEVAAIVAETDTASVSQHVVAGRDAFVAGRDMHITRRPD